jgi:uncharacterized protein (DUF1810 family)
MDDPYKLERFVEAQQPVFDRVCQELSQGRKQSHWMWYVFPQIRGLGRSHMAQRYAIASREEADAYLRHPLLGPRLRQCAGLLLQVEGRTIGQIMGWPDDLKLRSSMTLFAQAAADKQIFLDVLNKYYGGQPDPGTLERL